MSIYSDKFIGLQSNNNYNEETALSLAIACDLAYQDKELVESTATGWGYSQVKFLEVKKGSDIDTQYFVMADDNNIIIIFRGTDNLKDWFANFQAVRDPGPLTETKAHEGFQDALYPAVINLTNVIDEFGSRDKKLWLSGHSLGGALCSLYAGMLIENGYDIYGIYTFASPRPANEKFASQLNEKVIGPHYRVVNTGDIVPHVPPEPFFSHSGNRIILKQETMETSTDSWFDERVKALKVFIANTANLLDVADNHRLSADDESYIPRLIKDTQGTQ